MNRVKEFRTKKHLSQKALADAAGLSQPSVSQIEHGRSTSDATKARIASAVGVKQIRTLFPREQAAAE